MSLILPAAENPPDLRSKSEAAFKAGNFKDAYDGYRKLVLDPKADRIRIVDAGPCLSYALQWLAFGAIALIGVGVFVYREATGSREKEPLPYDKPYDDPHDDPDAY